MQTRGPTIFNVYYSLEPIFCNEHPRMTASEAAAVVWHIEQSLATKSPVNKVGRVLMQHLVMTIS